MHDSYMPLGGLVPMLLIQLGEVVFGGVGSGLYGMLIFAIIAVFIAGLMVGRTPEYLGKKIEAFEIKMAALAILIPVIVILIGAGVAVMIPAARASTANPGPHGFSEILYAFSSAAGNNGSAFAGLSADTPFYNVALGLAMLIGRYWVLIPALAIGGSLARKKTIPASAGTLPTHGPLFVGLLGRGGADRRGTVVHSGPGVGADCRALAHVPVGVIKVDTVTKHKHRRRSIAISWAMLWSIPSASSIRGSRSITRSCSSSTWAASSRRSC